MKFSNEAYFTLRESRNRKKNRLWLKYKPKKVKEVPLHNEKMLAWCAISARRDFETYFLESTVKKENYLRMLKIKLK